MILLNEVERYPNAIFAKPIIRVLQAIFAFISRQHGFTPSLNPSQNSKFTALLEEGGSATWEYLWRLRAKIFRAADMDPSYIWSREQASTFCRDFSNRDCTLEDYEPHANEPEEAVYGIDADFSDHDRTLLEHNDVLWYAEEAFTDGSMDFHFDTST